MNTEIKRVQQLAGIKSLYEGASPEALKKNVLSIKDKPEALKKFIQNVVGGIYRGTNWAALEDLRNILNIIKEEGIELK